MKPDKWAEIKALQRSAKPAQMADAAHIDKQRQQLGKASRWGIPGTPMKSRRPMRKAREKARSE